MISWPVWMLWVSNSRPRFGALTTDMGMNRLRQTRNGSVSSGNRPTITRGPMAADRQTDDLFEAGMLLFTQGNYPASIDVFTDVIRNRPDFGPAYLSRGTALMRISRMPEAIADFDKAIALEPGNDRSYNLRGLAWANLDRHDKAIEDYSLALQINPENTAAQVNRTNSLEALDYQQGIPIELPRVSGVDINSFGHGKSSTHGNSSSGDTPFHRHPKRR